jgi:hypothetical protein
LTASFLLVPVILAGAQSQKNTGPESFRANGQILGAAGGAASAIDIKIDKYTSDADHQALVKALSEGNDAFVAALKKAPKIGTVTVGNRSVDIHWARQRAQGTGRRIAVVTDAPVFFAGAGAVDAKPTAGYDLALAEFTIDAVGLGKGTMAPAAKVKAGGPTGIQVDDYSGKRIELVTVSRNVS